VRHQARDTAIAVEKWVYPEQAMMRGCGVDDGFSLSKARIGRLELPQETRYSAWANCLMISYLDELVA
jgi:hypothetical protein